MYPTRVPNQRKEYPEQRSCSSMRGLLSRLSSSEGQRRVSDCSDRGARKKIEKLAHKKTVSRITTAASRGTAVSTISIEGTCREALAPTVKTKPKQTQGRREGPVPPACLVTRNCPWGPQAKSIEHCTTRIKALSLFARSEARLGGKRRRKGTGERSAKSQI